MRSKLERAMQWHRKGDFRRAERAYRQILRGDPGEANALHFLGVLRHQQGNSTEAKKLIRRSIQHSPGYVDAYKNLGNVLVESGNTEEAEACYRKALALRPGDPEALNNLCVLFRRLGRFEESAEAGGRCVAEQPNFAAAWVNLGNAYSELKMIKRAIVAYERALALNNNQVEAHSQLCQMLYRLEQSGEFSREAAEKRMAAYRNWLEQDPDNPVARFMMAASDPAEVPDRAPDGFVTTLFDRFASSFDRNLALLEYRAPGLIQDRLEALPRKGIGRVLDAGCGTGLCGPFLKPLATHLCGVDLSPRMLDQARRRRCYDSLVEAELTQFLSGDRKDWDLVVSADTLCYFGALDEILLATAHAMADGGKLLFTVEKLAGHDGIEVKLNSSGRFSHSPEHVRRCLESGGFSGIELEDVTLRMESGSPVRGLLVEATRRKVQA